MLHLMQLKACGNRKTHPEAGSHRGDKIVLQVPAVLLVAG
jgi:hypothetical protein